MKTGGFTIAGLMVVLLGVVACSPPPERTAPPAPTDAWAVLLQRQPFPYTTPLPPQVATPLDGVYAKMEPKEGTPVPCRRCPDYLPQGGGWRLNMEQGVYRVFHQPTGWRSLGSFTVTADRLVLFNDPTCFETVGRYTWQLQGNALRLQALEDSCAVGRRAQTFAGRTWNLCPQQSGKTAPGCPGEQ